MCAFYKSLLSLKIHSFSNIAFACARKFHFYVFMSLLIWDTTVYPKKCQKLKDLIAFDVYRALCKV